MLGMGAIKNDRVARFLEKLSVPEETLSELLLRMCDGEGFYEICKLWDVPSGRVMEWLMADAGRFDRYQKALMVQREVLAERAVMEADRSVEISDGVEEDKVAIAKAALRVRARKEVAELRVGLAGVMAPERYSRRLVSDGGVVGGVDVGLLGLARDLLKVVVEGSEKREKVVEGVVIDNAGGAIL